MTQAHQGDQQDAASQETISVVDVPERSRFEITVDGAPAGFADYVDGTGDQAGTRAFPHTVIHDEFGRRGMSKVLIRTALDAARVDGLSVLPQCSAVKHFIDSNPEYADLVPDA